MVKRLAHLFLALSLLSAPNLWAKEASNATKSEPKGASDSQDKAKTKTKAVKIKESKAKKPKLTRLTLNGAIVFKRDCYHRFFIVSINKKYYVILYDSIDGEEAKTSSERLEICHKNRVGFNKGDVVNVTGYLIKYQGQEALYNASITSVGGHHP